MHPPPSRSAQTGVTLLEVMVSLVIFLIGAMGLMGYVGRSLNDSNDARMRAQAALLSQQYYARLDAAISTSDRGADLATYGAAITAATPQVCAAWIADTLNVPSIGLPNSNATCEVITTAESIHVRLSITWQTRATSAGATASAQTASQPVSHQFVTQKPIV